MLNTDTDSTNIPKKVHFIWFGDSICTQVMANILLCIEINRDFEVTLWSDFTDVKNLDKNYQFLHSQNVTIKSIEHNKDIFKNYLLIRKELDKTQPDYSAASDILRIDLMVALGGFYFDGKLIPKTSLNQFRHLFNKEYLCSFQYEEFRNYHKYVGNIDVMASKPSLPLFITAQRLLAEIDKTLSKPTYRNRFFHQSNTNINYLVTRTRTGASLAVSLEFFKQHTNIYHKGIITRTNVIDSYQIGIAKLNQVQCRSISSHDYKQGNRLAKELERLIFEKVLNEFDKQISQRTTDLSKLRNYL